MKNEQANQNQRDTAYRGMIPFYILFDLDLNANHLRMFGQIEQMESNPSPNVRPTFSYQWIADVLKINRRNAIKTAQLLKDKGYIVHTHLGNGQYIWQTFKQPLLDLDTQGVSPSDTPLVSPSDTPLVSPSDTQKTLKLKTIKESTTEKPNADAFSDSDMLRKYEIKPPKALTTVNKKYIQTAKDLLASKGHTLEDYLEYLTNKCPRSLLPYIISGVERTNGFGNILRPSFINDVLNGKWED